MIDKHGILPRLGEGEPVALELGCGARKRHPEALGVDALDFPDVDLVGDVFEVLARFPDGSVSAVYAYHFFEHVPDLRGLLRELARVMRAGGRLVVVTPHFSNPYYYSDYTHTTFFGLYTFSYLVRDDLFTRRVPQYDTEIAFVLRDVTLVFKSPRPFYGRYAVKRLFHYLFNLNTYLKEFYEENLSPLIPCYEIRYELER